MSDPLLPIVDAAVADAYRRGGANLVCRPGCSQCCIGIFPISQQDAARLREGLAALNEASPDIAARVHLRVERSLVRLIPFFPGDAHTGVLHENYEDTIMFEEYANDEPCSALDPEHGTCDLYAHRPVLCRTFGPPMATPGDDGETNLATCELCFTHASTEEIAAAQIDPLLHAEQVDADEAFNAKHGVHGETLIAFALRGPGT